MKKIFTFKSENKTPARQADSIKNEIKKYIARERRKDLPKDVDFWDFDCQFGDTDTDCKIIHVKEINKCIDQQLESGKEIFYIEILAKEAKREKREK